MNLTTLYSKDAKGTIRVYQIGGDSDNIYIYTGTHKGELIETVEPVAFGVGGRTQAQQIAMRIKSRINKKIDAGYVYDFEEAQREEKTNALGYSKAMKCIPFVVGGNLVPFTITAAQPKLNGHHCSIINDGGELVAFSNGGKRINSIEHILKGMVIPLGMQVEGELYHHGAPLQTISSWVRKFQPNSLKLKFACYDLLGAACYFQRYKILQSFEYGENAYLLETTFLKGFFDVAEVTREYLNRKFEGAILRLPNHPFESSKRSKGVIKCKPRHFGKGFVLDDEFLVVDIIPSRDGWAILVCENEFGGQFRVACHGDMRYKTYVFRNRGAFIGRHIRCEYAELTKDKKPSECVAIEWREKADE